MYVLLIITFTKSKLNHLYHHHNIHLPSHMELLQEKPWKCRECELHLRDWKKDGQNSSAFNK